MQNYINISSKENDKFKHVKQLQENARYRKKHKQTLLEGVHLLESFLQKNNAPMQIWLSEDHKNHPEVLPILNNSVLNNTHIFIVPVQLYKQLRSLGTGIDILAVIDIPNTTLSTIKEDTLILNDVQDIGNVGTLIRTASAVGVKHIICTNGTANAWSPKCLRAGMGSHFSVCIYENNSIAEILKSVQIPMLATSSHTQNIIYSTDLHQPVAWIMGNEGQGVCNSLMQQSTLIALPQPNGQESLNVAIAGSLCMYEMLRQRQYQ